MNLEGLTEGLDYECGIKLINKKQLFSLFSQENIFHSNRRARKTSIEEIYILPECGVYDIF